MSDELIDSFITGLRAHLAATDVPFWFVQREARALKCHLALELADLRSMGRALRERDQAVYRAGQQSRPWRGKR